MSNVWDHNPALHAILAFNPKFLDKETKAKLVVSINQFPKPSNVIARVYDPNDPDYKAAVLEVERFLKTDPYKKLSI